MDCFFEHANIPKEDIGNGVIFQDLCKGQNLNVFHWDCADKSEIAKHSHEQEQFGYVIKGILRVTIGEVSCDIGAGDAYIIPPNTPHSFVAIGATEAIDVFTPIRELSRH